jgi:hypothetical protein
MHAAVGTPWFESGLYTIPDLVKIDSERRGARANKELVLEEMRLTQRTETPVSDVKVWPCPDRKDWYCARALCRFTK